MARCTGDEAISAFGRYQRRRNLSPNTIQNRRKRLLQLTRFVAPKDLLEVTSSDVDRWFDKIGVSPATRYAYCGALSAFYGWAHKERLVKADPMEKVIRPKLGRAVPRPISAEDLAVACEMADPRMRAWLLLAAFAGFRVAEMTELRVEDIHRDKNLLLVHGKGNKERVVPLHPEVLEALIRFGLPQSGFVFRGRYNQQMRPATISFYVGRYLRSIGIAASAHRGRHTYGSAVYELSGGDIRLTQECLGHSSPVTTAAYAAWSPDKASVVVGQLSLHGDAKITQRSQTRPRA